ncbi:MAG TPA: hypothetical protein VGN86_09235 [Pyrinomonadaceae bacterium]|nr:hypothetical protein [Pyrinomonadaceae bacterium]
MKSPRIVAVFIFVFSLTGSTIAQEKTCKAKSADLPVIEELRGFRLGMTPDQVKARVPQVKFGHTNEFGVAKTSISPDYDPRIDKANFADVRTISLEFLDGTLSSIWVGFEGSFKWRTPEEFVSGISHELNLPGEWKAKGRNLQLSCADFELTVSMIAGGPSFRLIDTSADNTISQRRQEKQDAADAQEASPETPSVVGDTAHKVFYPVDCPALKLVPEKSRVLFASATEAEKAGYKQIETCP